MEKQTDKQSGNLIQRLKEKGLWEVAVQFVKFGIVGVSNTVISLAVYYVCFNLFHLDKQLCNFLGFIVGTLNSYFWNNRYVFNAGRRRAFAEHLATFARMFVSYGATGLLLTAALLWLWVDQLGISANLAPIINLVITVPLNFIINKFWAFKQRPGKDAPAQQGSEADGPAAQKE